MRHDRALALAQWLVDEWAPAADRIEIAGSIRREKPDVKDIEIVVIPRWRTDLIEGATADLFSGPPTRRVNLLRETVEAQQALGHLQVIKPGTPGVVPWHLQDDGRYWRLWLPAPEIKVDVFLQDAETWGLNLMIRTGSGVGPSGLPVDGFAPAMLTRWKAVAGLGARAEGARLYRPGQRDPESTREEADVFRLCRVRWVPPRDRISARAVLDNAYDGDDPDPRPPARNPRSTEAWVASAEGLSDREREIVRLVEQHGGLATFEVENLTGGLHQSISAAISGLYHRKRLLRPSGRTRLTPTGRRADVYEVGDPMAEDAPVQPRAGGPDGGG